MWWEHLRSTLSATFKHINVWHAGLLLTILYCSAALRVEHSLGGTSSRSPSGSEDFGVFRNGRALRSLVMLISWLGTASEKGGFHEKSGEFYSCLAEGFIQKYPLQSKIGEVGSNGHLASYISQHSYKYFRIGSL